MMPHHVLEPMLHPFPLSNLRPTQITVGYQEVALKRHAWKIRALEDRPDFLGEHMIPVVIGPKGHRWIIDHHHLALALHEEGVEHVLVSVVADLAHLKQDIFLTYMDSRNWFHPFDEKGRRQDYDNIPRHIRKLIDDPYRSLAGSLRRVGGYAKVDTPYAEFLWADFLRRKIKLSKLHERFDDAVAKALTLARSRDAAHLPGWSGVE
jgi:hypothetical protein